MYYIIDEWMRMTMIAIALGISEEKKKINSAVSRQNYMD